MGGLESFLPEPPEPLTNERVSATLRSYLVESFKKHPGWTKDQHIDYAAHLTAIMLNIDDRDLERLKTCP